MRYDAKPGDTIFSAVGDLKKELKKLRLAEAELNFNGIEITVSIDSFVGDIHTIYNLKRIINRENI